MQTKIKKWLKDLLAPANVVLIVLAAFGIIWMFMTISVMNHNYDLQRQVDQGKLDNQVMKLQNENLKLEQAYYKTDEYLDLSVRSLLGRANPGENMVILPRVQGDETDNAKTSVVSSKKSNIDQWIDFLMGRH